MRFDPDSFTYGAEHEFADVPVDTKLPTGWYRDPEPTIVNSNGIAADPTGKLYGFGCEINPAPTKTALGQVANLEWTRRTFPQARVNYRSNLHIHVRCPGLIESLPALKRVQVYIHEHMPRVIEVLVPLPRPGSADFPDPEELKGALRRWRRRRVSHRTLLTPERLKRQLSARSAEEFFNLEPPADREGKPLWHAQPRLCVSLRQLKQTDTVEFRHFPGTLRVDEMQAATMWCGKFLKAALRGEDVTSLLEWADCHPFPQFPRYEHWKEKRFRATVHDGTLSKEQIKTNIEKILSGKFDSVVLPEPKPSKFYSRKV